MKIWTVLLVSVLFLSGCGAKKEYVEEEPFITLTWHPAGLDRYENLYNRNIYIWQDGRIRLEAEHPEKGIIGDDAPVLEKDVSVEKIKELKESIQKNHFDILEEDLTSNSVDGTFEYISVHWEGSTKKVGGLNPDNKWFVALFNDIQELINQEEYSNWEKEIQNYMTD